MLRTLAPALLLSCLSTVPAPSRAQAGPELPATAPTAPASSSASSSASWTAQTPTPEVPTSVLLSSAVAQVRTAIGGVRLEKWKTSDAVRYEQDGNLSSIARDLDSGLPPLVSAADAQPGSTMAALNLVRNVDALYDVLLRVTERSTDLAPHDQADALRAALGNLDRSRRALEDRLRTMAAAQENQIQTLRASAAAHPVQPAPVCPQATAASRASSASRSSAKARARSKSSQPQ